MAGWWLMAALVPYQLVQGGKMDMSGFSSLLRVSTSASQLYVEGWLVAVLIY